MTPQELLNLCLVYGVKARISKDEVIVQVCLFCNNAKGNLELNPGRGVYKCWACGSKGALSPLLRKHFRYQGHIPVIPFSPTPRPAGLQETPVVKTGDLSTAAVEYLHKRGIGTVDALVYEIAEGAEPPWTDRVVFTLREYWDRDIVGAIGRGYYYWIHPKYFAAWRGNQKSITGFRTIGSTVHVLVEGVFDGIAVHRAGFNAAVLGGVEGAYLERWICRVPEQDTVIILLDGDAEVKQHQLHWQLFPLHNKIFTVDLPAFLDPAQLDPSVIRKLVKAFIRKDPFNSGELLPP